MSENTISNFIDEILKTSVLKAKDWLEAFKNGWPEPLWGAFLERPVSPDSIESLAIGISFQISRMARKMPKDACKRELKDGHRFLKEVCLKAQNCNAKVDLEKLDRIFVPGLEHVGEILAEAEL